LGKAYRQTVFNETRLVPLVGKAVVPMSSAEYILAFESILYGLIVSRILVKWNYMIQDDPPKRQYWAFWLFTVTVFLLIIYVYAVNGMNMDRHYQLMDSPKSFLFYAVLPPALFTFIVYQMFPREFKDVDLKEYILHYRARVIIPLIIYIAFNLFQFSNSLLDAGTVLGIIVISFSVSVVLIKKKWLFETFTIIFAIALFLGGYL
jgi:uncharacterized membrane protein YhdT